MLLVVIGLLIMHGRMINITRVLLAESYVATHFSTSLFSRALFLLLHHHRAAAPGAGLASLVRTQTQWLRT